MKKCCCLALLVAGSLAGLTQPRPFDYDQYFYYRNHQYLQTSSIFLTGANLKLAAADTSAAIHLLKQAARLGMYDTGYISGRSSFKFITQSRDWEEIKAIVQANRNRYADPANMEINTSDIDKFWQLYPRLHDKNADELFLREYILAGSHGLRTFFEVRMNLRATNLLNTVKERTRYYESIRPVSLALQQYKPQIISAAKKLKALYPAAIFPPTTFVMANFNAFGTADGGGGQLIGAEFLYDPATVDSSQLGAWEKSTITDSSRILGIVIHELIHIEQNTASSQTLLARSINEGAADFISQLVLGYNLNSKLHVYGRTHEKELWEKFSKQKDGEDISEWLYNGFDAKRSYPQDLGYYIGYKICEAYYKKAVDKQQAVKDILEIQDYGLFLKKSGYDGQSR